MTRSELVSGRGPGGLPVLVWRFDTPVTVASTAAAGGGIGAARWIVNVQVPEGYSRRDHEHHVAELATELGLVGEGVGMLTAADVGAVVRTADSGVSVEATVGITHPVWAAATEPARSDPPAGTINVVAIVPVALSAAALLNALCTVTEAKSQALYLCGVEGTGTASDAVTVVCPTGRPVEVFGGPRSRFGAPLARAVCTAVRTGCAGAVATGPKR